MEHYKLPDILNTIIIGDVLKKLKQIPSESVRCIVTSPPYYCLRDYGTAIWIGGDEKCDHKKTSKETIDSSLKKSTLNGGKEGQRVEYENKQLNKHKCNRCGAVRIDDQIGLEKTPEEYIAKMVLIFRECRRILKEDGTLWLNIGDSYWGGKGQSGASTPEREKQKAAAGKTLNKEHQSIGEKGWTKPTDGKHDIIKPKDLIGIPWMLAFALREDGWYLRSDIIWSKPNPMPESVTDRPTKSHEYIFLLTKSAKYYYDAEAIKQPVQEATVGRMERGVSDNHKNIDGAPGQTPHTMNQPRLNARKSGNLMRKPSSERGVPEGTGKNQSGSVLWEGMTANKKTVWNVATKPFKGAHFATFPETLIIDCIKAGTSEHGQCTQCGKPWTRVVKSTRLKRTDFEPGDPRYRPNTYSGTYGDINGKSDAGYTMTETVGWQPSCTCNGRFDIEKIEILPGDPDYKEDSDENYYEQKIYVSDLPLDQHPISRDVVMDIFGGAATTAVVSEKLLRDWILTELNPKYVKEIAVPRMQQVHGLFYTPKIIEQ